MNQPLTPNDSNRSTTPAGRIKPISGTPPASPVFTIYIPIASLILLLLIFIYQFFFYSPQAKLKEKELEKEKEFANTLLNKELYQQAIDAYSTLLNNFKINKKQKANLYYLMATIYQDKLNNYPEALGYLYKIDVIHPDFSQIAEVKKRIVACLERLNKSLEARQELSRFTRMDQSQTPANPDDVIAEFGERKITRSEFDLFLKRLPESIQKTLGSTATRAELLQEYIVTEIMYQSAKRAQLDQDPQTLKAMEEAQKAILVQRLLQDKIGQQLQSIKPDDIQLY
ncbi:MAG: hypothetical protein KBA26_11565, partial [Candidatus Delongbacteria bacterium]|nr:hypothetical protein [Candidatus Delongbacteria bacterium]